MNPYKNLTFYFSICLISIVGLIVNRIYLGNFNFRFDTTDLFLSTWFLIFCITSLFLFLLENKTKNQIPFFPLIIFYLLVCYGFNFEFLNGVLQSTKKDVLTKSLLIINLAIISFVIGYFSFIKFFNYRLLKFEFKNYNHLVILSLFFFLLILFDKYINIIPNYLNQVRMPLISITCIILYYRIITDNRKISLLYLIPIFILIFFELLSSSYVFPAMLSLQYVIIYFIVRRKIPIIPILFILSIFIFLHSFKYEYRFLLKLDTSNNYIVNRIEIFKDVYLDKIYTKKKENIISLELQDSKAVLRTEKSKADNFNRLGHSFNSLLILVEKTPSEIRYINGETYVILISKLIPRIIWRNKPSDTSGNMIGKKYKVLNKGDDATSWNVPIINEAYINFGYSGVIFIMLILGIFIRFFTNFFSNKNFKNFETHIGICICSTTFFWESHLSLVYGGIYYQILFLYIIIISYFLFLKLLKKE